MKIWIVTGNTESGDEIVPLAFSYKPVVDEVIKILKEVFPHEYEENGGEIKFSIDEVELKSRVYKVPTTQQQIEMFPA